MPDTLLPENSSDVAIFGRILESAGEVLSADAARAILALEFREGDRDRMHVLVGKAREGSLSPAEQVEIDNYERVGHILSLLKSKARMALKRAARPRRANG